jgi:hypothetical protein
MSLSGFQSRPASLPSWLPFAMIVAAVLAASLMFLWPAPLEFPMDDTYIHFVCAQNLARCPSEHSSNTRRSGV